MLYGFVGLRVDDNWLGGLIMFNNIAVGIEIQ